jgi:hypothetical protein
MCMTLDTPIPPETLQRIAAEIGAEHARAIVLPA